MSLIRVCDVCEMNINPEERGGTFHYDDGNRIYHYDLCKDCSKLVIEETIQCAKARVFNGLKKDPPQNCKGGV